GKTSAGSNPADSAATSGAQKPAAKATPAPKAAAPQDFPIADFAVQGADSLAEIDIETAIYPFLGPNKTADDVEKARAALEKAYHDKGYQTVSVSIPAQSVDTHVVVLKVTEGKVGALRVK